MQKNRPTPEEQLLNLMETEEDSKALKPKRKKSLFRAFVNLKRFQLFIPFLNRALRGRLAKLKNSIKEPNLKALNKVLIALSVVLVAYLITDFTLRRPDIKQVYQKTSVAKKRGPKEISPEGVRTFLYYLAMVQRRNIFSPVQLKSTEESQSQARETLDALAKNLKLVGISMGQNPQAMIEDKEEKKTYFLKTGDIINKLKVDAILEDSVILNYEGEKMELM